MKAIPEFIQRDPAEITAETKAKFEELLGREILPGQFEHLLLNTLVYREVLAANRFNAGLAGMLLEFSQGIVLDYLAQLVAVERLPAAFAGCTVRFHLVEGHGIVVIPEGTRVATSDGVAIFETVEDITVVSGINFTDITVIAQTAGKGHNDYAPGTVNKILDPYAFVSAVENLDTTGGGSDVETDEGLKERVRLAPAQYSSAGSRQSYLFHAKSGNALIKDISVTSPLPGTVLIVVLTGENETPVQVINDIYTACNDEKVRPLTDTVIVAAPISVDYSIKVNITLFESADSVKAKQEIEAALQRYSEENRAALGKDIIKSHITQRCRLNTVYDVEVLEPSGNLIVSDEEFANCTAIEVNIIGYNRG